MNCGIYLSSVGDYSDPTLLAELAREAEDVGWDGVFVFDHIGQPHAAADPWVTLAAIAMKTERVKFGPIVTPVARRRPWKLARETVTLDHLSNGRLILGVGLGWSDQEFPAFGEDGTPKIRAQKLDEGLEIIAGLWRGEPFNYRGAHFQIEDAAQLSFKDDSIDLVISQNVFHHIPNWEEAIKDIARVLRKGGYLIWMDLVFFKTIKQLFQPHVKNYGLYTTVDIIKAFERHGFKQLLHEQMTKSLLSQHHFILQRKGSKPK